MRKEGRKTGENFEFSTAEGKASTDFRWVFHSREEENPGKPRVSVCECLKEKSSNQREEKRTHRACVCVCVCLFEPSCEKLTRK